jgi:capsular exopolysaccharide synthesis family protein
MFAHLGYRCLVIDADLRRPSCHRALRVENERGLADLLVGQEDFEGTIQSTSIANLSVLSCGPIVPNPAELVGSQKMRQTLAELRDRYDFILIDSPPVMPVSDAIVLSTMVDGVVYVVRAQETPKYVVQTALDQLRTEHTKVLGVLLNRVDLRSAEYKDYNKYYGSDYYSNVRLA